MKLFIVWQREYADKDAIAFMRTREEAEKLVAFIKSKPERCCDDHILEIEESETDFCFSGSPDGIYGKEWKKHKER